MPDRGGGAAAPGKAIESTIEEFLGRGGWDRYAAETIAEYAEQARTGAGRDGDAAEGAAARYAAAFDQWPHEGMLAEICGMTPETVYAVVRGSDVTEPGEARKTLIETLIK